MMSLRRARGMRECRDGGERELAVTATFAIVSDSGDLARSQQRERDSGSRHIVLWEMRRSEWGVNGSKGGSGRGVSDFILPHGRGLG
jgi:hypothetical protein